MDSSVYKSILKSDVTLSVWQVKFVQKLVMQQKNENNQEVSMAQSRPQPE